MTESAVGIWAILLLILAVAWVLVPFILIGIAGNIREIRKLLEKELKTRQPPKTADIGAELLRDEGTGPPRTKKERFDALVAEGRSPVSAKKIVEGRALEKRA